MNTKRKKYVVLLLVVIMSIASMKFSSYAMGQPRVSVQINMSTDADNLDKVNPEAEINVTVTWKSVLASAGEPFTIRATNGAEILVHNEEDVEFQANGLSGSIKSVTRSSNGDTVTFMSGTPAASPSENTITFKIKAPSSAGEFNLSVKIGASSTPNNPSTNFAERAFSVNPLTVSTSLDVIDREEFFDVFGNANYDDSFMIAMEVYNKETGNVVFDSTTTDISGEGKYSLGSFSFNDTHATGRYVVEVVLLDSGYNQVASARKEIEHTKTPISYTVTYIYKDLYNGETFFSHTKEYEPGDTIILRPIYHSDYKFLSALVNGEQVEGSNVEVTVNEPLEVVYQFSKLYDIRYELHIGISVEIGMSSGGYTLGTVVDFPAPYKEGYKVTGAVVNGVRSPIINGNQVKVTVTGPMYVLFEYSKQ